VGGGGGRSLDERKIVKKLTSYDDQGCAIG
jgi:hypothetical protein